MNYLVCHDHNLNITLFRSSHFPPSLQPKNCVIRHLSFDTPADEMVDSLRGCDIFIHCAGSPLEEQSKYILGGSKLLFALNNSCVKRFIYISTVGLSSNRGGQALEGKQLTWTGRRNRSEKYLHTRTKYEGMIKSSLYKSHVDWCIIRIPMLLDEYGLSRAVSLIRPFRNLRLLLRPASERVVIPCVTPMKLGIVVQALINKSDAAQDTYQIGDVLYLYDLYNSIARDVYNIAISTNNPIFLLVSRIFLMWGGHDIYKTLSNETSPNTHLPSCPLHLAEVDFELNPNLKIREKL